MNLDVPSTDVLHKLVTNGWLPNQASNVYHQLLPDFPGPAIDWVKKVTWIGPMPVNLSAIDTENRHNWVATYEPDKVKLHQELITQGESKPVILAKIPGHDKLVIIDAHHRFLAYEAMRQNPVSYVADIPPEHVEAALTAHSKQYSGGSKLNGTDGV